ncbi:type II toxin-antitoxin system VapC family toxin [Fulvivirgaceae bacterium BMA12]|uniref:Type II toxin-antitoxin system VapC family toxin n=1 Tax=Agaribacillus aureus TaxID=3051825 RepID=A0ABT8L7X2_9BACT|nr:type II toxin-antitoxin system VapC family toxin [Fulvivirgaceae bacterium BMA12]
MELLLDTHILIWFITNDKKLPVNYKASIENKENKCFVSMVSYWEMSIKYALNRLELGVDLKQIFEIIHATGFDSLLITVKHIISNSKLNFYHRDPFDRLLIAQAQTEKLIILTKDEHFKKYNIRILS